jgi:hypothetical protein
MFRLIKTEVDPLLVSETNPRASEDAIDGLETRLPNLPEDATKNSR